MFLNMSVTTGSNQASQYDLDANKENKLPFFSVTLFLSLTSFSSVVTVPALKLVISDLPCWHLTSLINHTGPVIKRPILWYWMIRGKRG